MKKRAYFHLIAAAILIISTISSCASDTKRHPNGKPVSFKLVKNIKVAESSVKTESEESVLEDEVLISEKDIADVYAEYDYAGRPSMIIRFTESGAKKLADVTEKFTDRNMAVVFEGNIILSARIIEPIREGSLRISGSFTHNEIDVMVRKIRGSN